ncbi:MAG: P-II family nitrogen regulator [Clostridiales bacterium]|nr:P-II family nitrogen regulator [Clostridiales bacterium]
MELEWRAEDYIMFSVVVNTGIGTKIFKEAEKIGIIGGTVFLGRGTVKSHVLELLGLDQVKKEIVILIAHKSLEGVIHEVITEKFHLEKPNHGIAFSVSLNEVVGQEEFDPSTVKRISGGKDDMEYESIFTIVERGLGQEVVDNATAAGARGATIINARGSGIHHDTTFFSMRIEPEKEIVMIIIEKDKSEKIIDAIKTSMDLEKPGKGIIFSMDINRVSGIVKED